MVRSHRLFGCVLAAVVLCPALVRAQSGVDLIPADASAAFVINSISGIRDRGEKRDLHFLKGGPPALFDWMLVNLKGIDEKGSVAIVVPRLDHLPGELAPRDFNFSDLLTGAIFLGKWVYVALPVADVDEMASNFGLKMGELKPDKIYMLDKGKPAKAILLRGKHLFLAWNEEVLSLVPESRPVTGELNGQQKAVMMADLVLYVGSDSLGPLFGGWLDGIEKQLWLAGDRADHSLSDQVIAALRQTRFIVGGLSLDDGKFTFVARFNKGNDEATKLLSALPAGPGASDLVGLPAATPWITYAARGEGGSNVAMLPALLNVISYPPHIKVLGPTDFTWVGEILEILSVFDEGGIEKTLRAELGSAFEAMGKELKGIRVAAYPTSDPKRFGQFAVVGILDLGDVEKHLAGWHNLVKAINRAIERNSEGETQKLPPCTYQRRAKRLGDRRVDLITLEVPALPAAEDKRMTDTFGPDWNQVRLAVVGKQVAVLIGSDLDLLKQTVANLEAGKKGLADEKLTTGALSRLADERAIEFHFAPGRWYRNVSLLEMVAAIFGLEAKERNTPEETPQGQTSLALTIERDCVQLEIVPDKAGVKALFGFADDSSGAGTPRRPE